MGTGLSSTASLYFPPIIVVHLPLNFIATVFGQLWRLEPLPAEKKAMWRREMNCLLCVSDYIVELIPTWQTFPDGSKLEVQSNSNDRVLKQYDIAGPAIIVRDRIISRH